METLSGRNIQYYQMELKSKSYKFIRKQINDLFRKSRKYLFTFYRSNNCKYNPKEIKYEIIEKRLLKSNNKGDLSIRLQNKLTIEELTKLGKELKEKLFNNLDVTYINYYIPEINLDAAWAITHFFQDKQDFQIIGISISKEEEFMEIINNEKRNVIGQWVDESPYGGGLITLFKKDKKVFLENIYKDRSKSLKEQISIDISEGTKYEDKQPSGSEEYIIVDKMGLLKYFDPDGLVFEIKKQKYKLG